VIRIVEVQREVADLGNELIQLGSVLVHAAKFHDALAHVLCELIAQRPPRHAHHGELLRQQAVLLQVKERRQQLALGQVARRAKDGNDHRVGNALVTLRDLGKIRGIHLHLNRGHGLASGRCAPS